MQSGVKVRAVPLAVGTFRDDGNNGKTMVIIEKDFEELSHYSTTTTNGNGHHHHHGIGGAEGGDCSSVATSLSTSPSYQHEHEHEHEHVGHGHGHNHRRGLRNRLMPRGLVVPGRRGGGGHNHKNGSSSSSSAAATRSTATVSSVSVSESEASASAVASTSSGSGGVGGDYHLRHKKKKKGPPVPPQMSRRARLHARLRKGNHQYKPPPPPLPVSEGPVVPSSSATSGPSSQEPPQSQGVGGTSRRLSLRKGAGGGGGTGAGGGGSSSSAVPSPPPQPPNHMSTIVSVSDNDEEEQTRRRHGKKVDLAAQQLPPLPQVDAQPQPRTHQQEDSSSAEEVDLGDWGYPGFLTPEEQDVFNQFRNEMDNRPPSFCETIFSFGIQSGEPEEYALCRWLRARKFHLQDTITMIEQATSIRVEPSKVQFYPDAADALGVPESIYKSQYPQVYYGQAKNKSSLFISKPGAVNLTGMDCVTTVGQMRKYQWHSMIHAFGGKLREFRETDLTFNRYQSTCLLDLDGLSREAISKRMLDLLKDQSYVDSMCFPETLNRLVVINAPPFFSLTWRMIKRWLDPRTVSKIEIYSGRSQWQGRVLELIDAQDLPVDYGGLGEAMDVVISRMDNTEDGGIDRRETKTLGVRHSGSVSFDLMDGEVMDVDLYTRSTEETKFTVERVDCGGGGGHGGHHHRRSSSISKSHSPPLGLGEESHLVQFGGGEEGCYHKTIGKGLVGPGRYRFVADSSRSRYSSAEHFLLVANINKV